MDETADWKRDTEMTVDVVRSALKARDVTIDAQAERIQARYLEGVKDGSRRSSTRITEQAERIRALEAAIEIPQIIDANLVKARKETATAIAREIEECLQKMAPTIPSLDAERVCRGICRANGADV